MLLQRPITPQLTSIPNVSNNLNSNKPPFLILVNIQEHTELDTRTISYSTYINNNVGSISTGEQIDQKRIAVVCRNTSESGMHPLKYSLIDCMQLSWIQMKHAF